MVGHACYPKVPTVTTAAHNQHATHPELAAELGALIRTGRERVGWSQRGMAARLGVSHGAVVQWECGYTLPRFEIVIALSRLFDFKLDDLVAPGRTLAEILP